MIEHNTVTNECHVFCERCQKEIVDPEQVYYLITGDCMCKDCFDASYKISSVEDYIHENIH